jgi:hypothetical protein
MVATSRWKPETRKALRGWIRDYMKEHRRVRSKTLLEEIQKDNRFYRLTSLTTFKLGFLLRGLPIERVATTRKGNFEYYYVWKPSDDTLKSSEN